MAKEKHHINDISDQFMDKLYDKIDADGSVRKPLVRVLVLVNAAMSTIYPYMYLSTCIYTLTLSVTCIESVLPFRCTAALAHGIRVAAQ